MALLRNADLLRSFLAVARTGNLSAAARELSVSQPALTKSVRKLEQQVGVTLFDRRARGMALTPSGTALPAASTLPPGIEMEEFGQFHLRVLAGLHHPLHRKRRVTTADLARYSWVLYQHDQDTLDKLTRVLRAAGGQPPNVLVVTTSLHAVMRFLKAGPYLACLADSYV